MQTPPSPPKKKKKRRRRCFMPNHYGGRRGATAPCPPFGTVPVFTYHTCSYDWKISFLANVQWPFTFDDLGQICPKSNQHINTSCNIPGPGSVFYEQNPLKGFLINTILLSHDLGCTNGVQNITRALGVRAHVSPDPSPHPPSWNPVCQILCQSIG